MDYYEQPKQFNGKTYIGMKVGNVHNWDYQDATWRERKVSPEQWTFKYNAIKKRKVDAPEHSGAPVNTQYHWLIIAEQKVNKLNANQYNTNMQGIKLKLGHKRPYWKHFSYEYDGQETINSKAVRFITNAAQAWEQIRKITNNEKI